jgi:septal ring factor EnvC (AmiA/AmiB activator)
MRRVMRIGLAGLCVAGLLAAGCTKYANEENLARLEDQKRAALSAEKVQQEKQAEKAQLQRELDQLKAELEQAEAEFENIKQ